MEKEAIIKLYKEHIVRILPFAYLQELRRTLSGTDAQVLFKDAKFNVLLSADKTKLFFAAELLCSTEKVTGFIFDLASKKLLHFRTVKLLKTKAGAYYFLADGVKFDLVIVSRFILPSTSTTLNNAVKITHNGVRAEIGKVNVDISDFRNLQKEVGGNFEITVVGINSPHSPTFNALLYTNDEALLINLPPTTAFVAEKGIRNILHGNVLILKEDGENTLPLSDKEQEAVLYVFRSMYSLTNQAGEKFPVCVYLY